MYDLVNRIILLKDCRRKADKGINHILSACFQPLTISTKGDVQKSTVTKKLGLTQEASLSMILFLVYIDYLYIYGTEQVDEKVVKWG